MLLVFPLFSQYRKKETHARHLDISEKKMQSTEETHSDCFLDIYIFV